MRLRISVLRKASFATRILGSLFQLGLRSCPRDAAAPSRSVCDRDSAPIITAQTNANILKTVASKLTERIRGH